MLCRPTFGSFLDTPVSLFSLLSLKEPRRALRPKSGLNCPLTDHDIWRWLL